jgi:hypothetical protein
MEYLFNFRSIHLSNTKVLGKLNQRRIDSNRVVRDNESSSIKTAQE